MNMSSIVSIFSTIVLFSLFELGFTIGSIENKYNYFDDYLSSLDELQQNQITGDDLEVDGSGSEPDTKQELNPEPSSKFGFKKTEDTICCSLGYLAGSKDYHCIAKFYAARTLLRNRKRIQNGKMLYSSTKLVRTLEQCVSAKNQPRIFNRCCQKAAMNSRLRPHFVTVRRKRYEMKMKRIRLPMILQEDDHLIIVPP